MYVEHFFHLDRETRNNLAARPMTFGYGLFGQVVYLDHYSRTVNGVKEQWHETVIRVIEGIFSIRKDYYIKNRIRWDEQAMQHKAIAMAESLFRLTWSPSGRGLWAMGTQLMCERGAMFLYNCALTKVVEVEDFCWFMDALMCGAGVSGKLEGVVKLDIGGGEYPFPVPDSREGWVHSVRLLLSHYLSGAAKPIFDYSLIRKKGEPLKMFGGTSSGSQPLIDLHDNIDYVSGLFRDGYITTVEWVADICNLIGCCVVAGNIRRSAEMLLAPPSLRFRELKDSQRNPYRVPWSWMSNNTEILKDPRDFETIKLSNDGEQVGYLNAKNLPYGRLRFNCNTEPEDHAIGVNPCGEIPLEDKEVCNVVETLPTRCNTHGEWLRAISHATFYASTVALLPTHNPDTNAVIRRNRRIGVGIVDYVGWVARHGLARVITRMREGYDTARMVNRKLAAEAGVPESIRVTTIKPGGTMPKLAGCNPGCSYPFANYIIRRKRVASGSEMADVLKRAGVPWEKDFYSDNTLVFEFPVHTGCNFGQPSLWQQAMNLVTLQREWADNAVSNTLWYDDSDNLIDVASAIMPMIKSVSFIKRDTSEYVQLPEEAITEQEYNERVAAIRELDFHEVTEDGRDEKYCQGDACVVGPKNV